MRQTGKYPEEFEPENQRSKADVESILAVHEERTCIGKVYRSKFIWIPIVAIVIVFHVHVYIGLFTRAILAYLVPFESGAHNGLEHVISMMPCMISVLEQNNATWFLDEGSLLGAYREGGAIKGDSDIDIGLLQRESDKFPAIKQGWEKKCNFYVVHRDDHQGVKALSFFTARKIVMRIFSSYWGPEWYIDVREYDVSESGVVYDRHFLQDDDTYFIPQEDMFPTVNCNFSGVTAQCPRNTLYVIEELYGADWNVPKKGFKTHMMERPTPLQLYNKAIERIKKVGYPRGPNFPPPPPRDVVEVSEEKMRLRKR